MKKYFKGYYYKHQNNGNTLCLIVGETGGEKFIQVITDTFSTKLPFTKGNYFSPKGILLNINKPGLSLSGKIRYQHLSPIRYDIMGPFRFLPMECRHGIISMQHDLIGKITLNGETIDFTGGKGYIEMDSGCSFPSSYTWIQANDFAEDCSIMAAIATIPIWKFKFRGCICVIQYHGKEYRLATYLGVKVLCCTDKRILLKQGKYRLSIKIDAPAGLRLRAPDKGKMTRTILENASCPAEFIFYKGNRKVFDLSSKHASFEFE